MKRHIPLQTFLLTLVAIALVSCASKPKGGGAMAKGPEGPPEAKKKDHESGEPPIATDRGALPVSELVPVRVPDGSPVGEVREEAVRLESTPESPLTPVSLLPTPAELGELRVEPVALRVSAARGAPALGPSRGSISPRAIPARALLSLPLRTSH